MATAVLAGANPMAGLYASIAGPAVGGALSSTSVMVIGATSAAAVTASQVMNADPADPARTLATLTVLAGLIMLLATWLGFHRLLRFVSASVMAGFLFGIGLVLVFGQLADATGTTARGATVAEKAWNTVGQWQDFHWPSVATAAAAIAITAAFGKGRLSTVGPVIGVLAPTIAVRVLGVDVATVGDVGAITVGLPPLVLPDPALITPDVVASAVAVALVVLVQAAGVGAAYPNADGRPTDVRRDFWAQGAANVASAVVGGIPVGGSVGQTAVNVLAGSRSRWAAILSGVWMLVFVVAAGPVLSTIPMPALAGLLMLAGVNAMRPSRLLQSWRSGRSSALAAAVTLVTTLVAPVHWAVILGVVLSLLLVGVHAAGDVRAVGLVRQPDGGWLRVEQPDVASAGGVTVVDIEGPAAFDAADDLFHRLPAPDPSGAGAVVLRMRSQVRTNLTSFLALRQYARAHGAAGGQVLVCGLDPDVIGRLERLGLEENVVLVQGSDRVNGSLDQAWALATEALGTPEGPATR